MSTFDLWKKKKFDHSRTLNNEQLNKIEQKARAKNTKKATNWGVKKFEKTCDKRKIKFSGSQKSKSKGLELNYAKVLR